MGLGVLPRDPAPLPRRVAGALLLAAALAGVPAARAGAAGEGEAVGGKTLSAPVETEAVSADGPDIAGFRLGMPVAEAEALARAKALPGTLKILDDYVGSEMKYASRYCTYALLPESPLPPCLGGEVPDRPPSVWRMELRLSRAETLHLDFSGRWTGGRLDMIVYVVDLERLAVESHDVLIRASRKFGRPEKVFPGERGLRAEWPAGGRRSLSFVGQDAKAVLTARDGALGEEDRKRVAEELRALKDRVRDLLPEALGF